MTLSIDLVDFFAQNTDAIRRTARDEQRPHPHPHRRVYTGPGAVSTAGERPSGQDRRPPRPVTRFDPRYLEALLRFGFTAYSKVAEGQWRREQVWAAKASELLRDAIERETVLTHPTQTLQTAVVEARVDEPFDYEFTVYNVRREPVADVPVEFDAFQPSSGQLGAGTPVFLVTSQRPEVIPPGGHQKIRLRILFPRIRGLDPKAETSYTGNIHVGSAHELTIRMTIRIIG